jgi:hypothetical protein
MILFFSAPAINVDWTPVGPNDTMAQPIFTDTEPAETAGEDGGRPPLSDSLALITSGLIMIFSASFLRRLTV